MDMSTIMRNLDALHLLDLPGWMKWILAVIAVTAALLKTFIDFRPSRWRRDDWEVLKVKCEIMAMQKQHGLPSTEIIDARVSLNRKTVPFVVKNARLFTVPLWILEMLSNLMSAIAWFAGIGAVGATIVGLRGAVSEVVPYTGTFGVAAVTLTIVAWIIGKMGTYFEETRLRIELDRDIDRRRRKILAGNSA